MSNVWFVIFSNNLKIFSTGLLTWCVTRVMYHAYLKITAVSGKNDGLKTMENYS